MCCHKGHVLCRECIVECFLAQKKDIQRRLAAHASQKNQDKDEEEEKLMLQKARELDEFDQQNHGALPRYSDKSQSQDKNATPGASVRVQDPETHTVCPEGKEKLKLKNLFAIRFTEDNSEEEKKTTSSSSSYDRSYIFPSCKVTLTNTMSLVALSSCGHVFCKKCGEKFMPVDKVCLVCDKPCKDRNLVGLKKGGTGFAEHDDHLEAKEYKHLGSGSGLGLVRPVKT
ncbi:unnamed protein product [Microthlaspi erraticum]|uniref:RING-type domain-containing protein n=1 Tax=Microthlaspi erraticum TaxID=1685480 RepID=A0A6D2HEQ5_9BRAS|nr:unnamed protein product [Microthlaspi erraticum]